MLLIYRIAKAMGLFALSRQLHRRRLLILCYHGFAVTDEHRFRPMMFMREQTFANRMSMLARQGYHVLDLEEALQRLADDSLPPNSVVITVDDGFKSFLTVAMPILDRFRFPATVYVTTYYVAHQNPVFGLLAQYFCWKAGRKTLPIDDAMPPHLRERLGRETRALAVQQLVRFGEDQLTEDERQEVLTWLAARLSQSLDQVRTRGTFSLMAAPELAVVSHSGYGVQLHTHRHDLPEHPQTIDRELSDNRAVLEPIARKRLHHLCYPSGAWSPLMFPQLIANSIQSATTCEPGWNDAHTPRLALRRFLDSDAFPPILFEAEISGFKQILRQLRTAVFSLRRSPPVTGNANPLSSA